ncbi:MAG: sigma-70 family RNA polymerase sigma factor [Lewinellaceae bacterium]|nr:sigma-70 family RNA polymerase sigma factor [Lewinellaceae bacterium]
MFNREINLDHILEGCRQGNQNSQRKLYEHFYGYAMNICLRYSGKREEAVEILNDAFFKVMTGLDKYDSSYPFRAWLRRILINSAIDYYRKNWKQPVHLELTRAADVADDEMPMPTISPDEDVLPILRALSPAYRMVFNLYVLEGYKHQEIAVMLGISVSTSRSNFVRALENLRALMLEKKSNPVKSN